MTANRSPGRFFGNGWNEAANGGVRQVGAIPPHEAGGLRNHQAVECLGVGRGDGIR